MSPATYTGQVLVFTTWAADRGIEPLSALGAALVVYQTVGTVVPLLPGESTDEAIRRVLIATLDRLEPVPPVVVF